ncbi:MAG: hypothetical protein IPG83_18100 [Novosphingobium sp.]|jgi:hypothetical protein|nr:hypothetical protein [Novosphingobium sp.]
MTEASLPLTPDKAHRLIVNTAAAGSLTYEMRCDHVYLRDGEFETVIGRFTSWQRGVEGALLHAGRVGKEVNDFHIVGS